MPKDDLPSIEQFVSDDNLPSIDEFIKEETEQELPSVENFIEKEEEEIQDLVEEFVPEEKSLELNEVLRLINDVRESVPEIPEIKYYDKELEDICESIQILASSIPEVKYYDSDIESLQNQIQEVRSEIPVFPKWVNEVNEVPDFSWIGKTFSVIDDDFIKVNDSIETLRERIEINIRDVVEGNEVKHFENNAKKLAEYLVEFMEGAEVTYFCSDLRLDDLPSILEKNNIKVTEVEAYQTKYDGIEVDDSVESVMFYSPSTVQSFVQKNKIEIIAFCIGETTAKEAEKHFNDVRIAKVPTVESVIELVNEYYV